MAVVTDAQSEATAQSMGTPTAPGGPGPVMDALRSLGWAPVLIVFDGDPTAWTAQLANGRFQLVFNLCEGLNNQGAGEPVAAGIVELLGIPMTGAPSEMLALCLRKDRTNAVLRAHGIAVPDWLLARPDEPIGPWRRFPAIVKPAAEDGSFGIANDSVVRDRAALETVTATGCRQWGRMLIQRFIPGREFTLAIVGGRVLPHAEIDFSRLPRNLPPLVTYAAKWHYGSPEEQGTVPHCPARLPAAVASELTRLARRIWVAVDGAGYGRIDVRADGRGTLYVADVNPNPDLGPTAGLARQAAAAGWRYVDLIGRIVDDALTRKRPVAVEDPAPPAAAARAAHPGQGMPYTQRLSLAAGRREPQRTRAT